MLTLPTPRLHCILVLVHSLGCHYASACHTPITMPLLHPYAPPQVAKDVDPAQVTTLASANPQLAARLIVELGKPLAADTAAGAAAVAGQGGRKRARG